MNEKYVRPSVSGARRRCTDISNSFVIVYFIVNNIMKVIDCSSQGSVLHLENSNGSWYMVTELTRVVHVISVVLVCP